MWQTPHVHEDYLMVQQHLSPFQLFCWAHLLFSPATEANVWQMNVIRLFWSALFIHPCGCVCVHLHGYVCVCYSMYTQHGSSRLSYGLKYSLCSNWLSFLWQKCTKVSDWNILNPPLCHWEATNWSVHVCPNVCMCVWGCMCAKSHTSQRD